MGLTIEVFTAGNPDEEPVLALVQELVCRNCDVRIYDVSEAGGTAEARLRAERYAIRRLPAVVIDGRIAACCANDEPITRDSLLASVNAG